MQSTAYLKRDMPYFLYKFQKVFTNGKKYAIINVPNELNKRIYRYVVLCGIAIPFIAV